MTPTGQDHMNDESDDDDGDNDMSLYYYGGWLVGRWYAHIHPAPQWQQDQQIGWHWSSWFGPFLMTIGRHIFDDKCDGTVVKQMVIDCNAMKRKMLYTRKQMVELRAEIFCIKFLCVCIECPLCPNNCLSPPQTPPHPLWKLDPHIWISRSTSDWCIISSYITFTSYVSWITCIS